MFGRLSIRCPDQPGIVAAVSGYMHQMQCNIVHLDQHATEPDGHTLFMRLEFEDQGGAGLAALRDGFAPVAEAMRMHWHLTDAASRPRVGLLASRTDHCLLELLWRWQRGELPCDIGLVVSNHDTLRAAVERFGVRFEHVPVSRDSKAQAEARQAELLADCELLVLARYMQILSPDFVARWPARIINIHHSFLPAFVGADPYRQAWERGVKLIGATAHYVTDDLDEGPIIHQLVEPVTHRESVADLRHLGQELERKALYQAVRWHLEERGVVHGRKTTVFR